MDSLNIAEIINFDLQTRSNEEIREEDIHEFESLSLKEWDYNLPTVYYCDASPCLIKDSASVKEEFLSRYPIFKDVDMKNILIAGGSITNIAICNEKRTDVDLFIYGLSVDEVSGRINKLIEDLNLEDHSGKLIKTKYATTIILTEKESSEDEEEIWEGIPEDVCDSNIIIQIIHRLYETPSQVIHGFDNGACSVGLLFDECKVITTNLGRVALEYRINIWDASKRGMAYETRLVKYFMRGFNIVFPNLDTEKVKEKMENYQNVMLKGINFYAIEVEGNMLKSTSIHSVFSGSDYSVRTDRMDKISNSRYNFHRLLKGGDLVYYNEWENKQELLSFIDDNKIHYPTQEYIEDTIYGLSYITEKEIKIEKLSLALPDEYKDLVMEFLSEKDVEAINVKIRRSLLERVLDLFEQYNVKGGYIRKWITLDPGSQLDGSFHPEPLSLEDFYGDFLKLE